MSTRPVAVPELDALEKSACVISRPCVFFDGGQAGPDLAKLIVDGGELSADLRSIIVAVPLCDAHDAATRSRDLFDESLTDEHLNRLADCRTPRLVRFRELSLRWQPAADRQLPRGDLFGQLRSELMGLHRWLGHWALTVPSWSAYGSTMALQWYRRSGAHRSLVCEYRTSVSDPWIGGVL